jgi:hypothetical protein
MAKVAGASSKGRRASASTHDASITEFVICVDPHGHDDLQSRRVSRVMPDDVAARSRFFRVIDDSGEDYLYPASCFLPLILPPAVRRALAVST